MTTIARSFKFLILGTVTATLISVISISLLRLLASSASNFQCLSQNPISHPRLKVYVAPLRRALNYGLLEHYWSLSLPDSRLPYGSDPDHLTNASYFRRPSFSYPENPVIKQYSAEYWILGDLETSGESRDVRSVAQRVETWEDADVVFVPFFATLSAELELGWGRKGWFGKKGNENMDYVRQMEVIRNVTETDAWKRSGGKDHVFVLTGSVFLWSFFHSFFFFLVFILFKRFKFIVLNQKF